jgi:hypothetical protein
VADEAVLTKAELWDKYCTAAPARQRWCIERYNLAMRSLMNLLPIEIEPGFQEIGVFDILGHNQSGWTCVPATVPGDSDIVVRLGYEKDPGYQHIWFGVHENLPNSTPIWHGINIWSSNVRQVITDAQLTDGQHHADEVGKIILVRAVKAKIRCTPSRQNNP